MQNPFDEVRKAFNEAQAVRSALDASVVDMARFIKGRLQKAGVPCYVLKELKDELRNYNAHTGRWRK